MSCWDLPTGFAHSIATTYSGMPFSPARAALSRKLLHLLLSLTQQHFKMFTVIIIVQQT